MFYTVEATLIIKRRQKFEALNSTFLVHSFFVAVTSFLLCSIHIFLWIQRHLKSRNIDFHQLLEHTNQNVV